MELESRFTDPRPDCPHPDRWHSPDGDSTEIEVSRLVAAFVEALRPDLVIETGTAFGQTAELIGDALGDVPNSWLITFETDPERAQQARERCIATRVEVREKPSLQGIQEMVDAGSYEKVGFAWLDSLFGLRVSELATIRPLLSPGAIVGIHDCGEPGDTKYNDFSQQIAGAATRMGFNRISLPTPRGVTFLQWKG
jgi:predicted O-methyltransferase YrrM